MLKSCAEPQAMAKIAGIMAQPDPERFQSGDVIEFQKCDGWKWPVTILGRNAAGDFDAMFYTGEPWHFTATEDELAALRIVRVDVMDGESVTMYRRLLGLEEWPVEVEA